MAFPLHDKNGQHAERVYLGAFGKHPGWDDHMDDPGLETPRLAASRDPSRTLSSASRAIRRTASRPSAASSPASPAAPTRT